MAVEAAIAGALFSHLGTLALVPTLPISWPGLSFTAPAGPYLRADFLPNRTVRLFTADADPDEYRGIFQVTVVWPVGQGIIGAQTIAGAVCDHFGKGTRIPADNPLMTIEERPSIAPPIQDASRLRVPVSVRYRLTA